MPAINRIREFNRILTQKKEVLKTRIGEFCYEKMNYYVPVDTGFLKSKNQYKDMGDTIRLINDCPYAGFVERGTRKMIKQPFIYPSLFNHLTEIKQIVRGVYSGL